ncbi:hypothetical protein L218DRAFT_365784 [Marasmius fiardii PR-910]|nr:hypothetical protein L218DRAFT_365784 [Marasmius fiardii PR-910]
MLGTQYVHSTLSSMLGLYQCLIHPCTTFAVLPSLHWHLKKFHVSTNLSLSHIRARDDMSFFKPNDMFTTVIKCQ